RSEGVSRRARQAVEQIVELLGQTPSAHTGSTGTGETARPEPARPPLRPPAVEAGLMDLATIEPARTSLRPSPVQGGLTAPATTDITVIDTPEAVLAAFCERQWCDGLAVVPTRERRGAA